MSRLAELAVRLYTNGTAEPSESGEVTIICPLCHFTSDRGNGKFAFNVERELGHCFHCGKGLSLVQFIHAGNLDERLKRYNSIAKTYAPRTYSAPAHGGSAASSELQYEPLSTSDSILAIKARTYLNERGFPPELISTYHIGVGTSDRELGRLILPVFESGQLFYYQARAIVDGIEPKYLNPPRSSGLGKRDAVGYLDRMESHQPVMVTEGLFSAIGASISFSLPAVAILGKTMSETQRAKILSKKPSEVVIYLDSDASQLERLNLKRSFSKWGLKVSVIELTKGDPWDAWIQRKGFVLEERRTPNVSVV